jgi:hypothetical protein
LNKVVRITGFEQEQNVPFMNVSFEVVTPVGTFHNDIDMIKPTTFDEMEEKIFRQLVNFFSNVEENKFN